MSFADLMKATFYATMPRHFGEPVTIGSPDAESRIVWGIVHRRSADVEGQRLEHHEETLTFRCGRDEAHEKGGIDRAHGKQLTLVLAGEEDLGPWAFSGMVTDETSYAHTLEFKRSVVKRLNRRGP
jgi:hypothetical protein